MKKITFTVIAALVVLAIVVLAAKPEYKWLLFNGSSAEKYATALLEGDNPKSPDWAIDLTTTTENGVVIFAEHNAEKLYAYSPDGMPEKESINWSKIWGYWYVGFIRKT